MKQLLLPTDYKGQQYLTLNQEDSHYLKNVRRIKKNDCLNGIDYNGQQYLIKIVEINKQLIDIELSKKNDKTLPNTTQINIYQSIPKTNKIEKIVRTAAEAGIHNIYLVKSDYTIAKITSEYISKKKSRLDKIIKEAIQQSNTNIITKIAGFTKLNHIKKESNELFLFFHQISLENKSLHRYLLPDFKSINILIGPEGGFSDNEVAWMLKQNFKPVFLGETVLKSDTASIYAIGAVKTIIMEKDEWILKQ